VSYKIKLLKIHIFGDAANVFCLWNWKGNILSDSGRQMSTYIKQDNKWEHIGGMGCSCEKPIKCQ
jgi:hypothetical protein